MPKLQRLAILGVIIGAIISTFTGMTALSGTHRGSSEAQMAIEQFDALGPTTNGVYQQQVLALWANKDLLKVVADEASNANDIARISTILTSTTNWLLVCLILVLISRNVERRSKKRAKEEAESPSSPDVYYTTKAWLQTNEPSKSRVGIIIAWIGIALFIIVMVGMSVKAQS